MAILIAVLSFYVFKLLQNSVDLSPSNLLYEESRNTPLKVKIIKPIGTNLRLPRVEAFV